MSLNMCYDKTELEYVNNNKKGVKKSLYFLKSD